MYIYIHTHTQYICMYILSSIILNSTPTNEILSPIRCPTQWKRLHRKLHRLSVSAVTLSRTHTQYMCMYIYIHTYTTYWWQDLISRRWIQNDVWEYIHTYILCVCMYIYIHTYIYRLPEVRASFRRRCMPNQKEKTWQRDLVCGGGKKRHGRKKRKHGREKKRHGRET